MQSAPLERNHQKLYELALCVWADLLVVIEYEGKIEVGSREVQARRRGAKLKELAGTTATLEPVDQILAGDANLCEHHRRCRSGRGAACRTCSLAMNSDLWNASLVGCWSVTSICLQAVVILVSCPIVAIVADVLKHVRAGRLSEKCQPASPMKRASEA